MTHDEAFQELILLRQQVADLTMTNGSNSVLPPFNLTTAAATSNISLESMPFPDLAESFQLSENIVWTFRFFHYSATM